MTAPEPFEAVFGYVVSVEGSEAGDCCYRAIIAYANAAPYDPTGICIDGSISQRFNRYCKQLL